MRETIVVLWCDRHHAKDGSKVEATDRVVPGIDGQAANLDLCKACAAEARGMVREWMKIGDPVRARKKPSGRPPASPGRAEFLARLRDWCDTRGMRNGSGTGPAYETASGARNYGQVEPQFAAWEAGHGQWDRARWLTGHPGDAAASAAAVNGTAPAQV